MERVGKSENGSESEGRSGREGEKGSACAHVRLREGMRARAVTERGVDAWAGGRRTDSPPAGRAGAESILLGGGRIESIK